MNLENFLLYFFVYILEAGILWWYIYGVFTLKHSKAQRTITISVGYGILFLLSFISSVQINAIAFTLINFIIIKLLCYAKWYVCLFHALIPTCFAGVSEIGSFALFSQFKETGFYTDSHMLLVIIVTLLSKLLYFICVSIIRWRFSSKHNLEYTGRVTALLNIIPLILIYIIVTLLAFILSTAPSAALRYMLSVSSFLLLIINFVIIYIYHYTQKKNVEFVELQLQLQKEYDMAEYYKTLFTQNKNQQILIHDIRKHLTSLAQLNAKNEQIKIQEYLETLLNSSELQDSVRISDNDMVNSILCHYTKICHDKGIKFKTDIRANLLKKLDYPELTSLFCNLLDNAVEACSNIPASYIEVSVLRKSNSNLTLISIINTCRIAPAFDDSGFPVSSKKDPRNHGLGLKSVNRIVNKYDGNIKMYYDSHSATFHTIIILNNA